MIIIIYTIYIIQYMAFCSRCEYTGTGKKIVGFPQIFF